MIGLILVALLAFALWMGLSAHRDCLSAEEAARTPEAIQKGIELRDRMVRELIDGNPCWASPLFTMERSSAVDLQCSVISLAVAEIRREKESKE